MATKEWIAENQDKLREYRRRWYARNKQHAISRSMDRRKELQRWLVEVKSTLACIRCGENHPGCIDLHHRDPSEKEVEVALVVMVKGWSKARILKEIAKCDPLCANCHRKLHWDERQILDPE